MKLTWLRDDECLVFFLVVVTMVKNLIKALSFVCSMTAKYAMVQQVGYALYINAMSTVKLIFVQAANVKSS